MSRPRVVFWSCSWARYCGTCSPNRPSCSTRGATTAATLPAVTAGAARTTTVAARGRGLRRAGHAVIGSRPTAEERDANGVQDAAGDEQQFH
ncbi:hypothetical protein ACWEOE_28785 [Amycolatopsis sp. NPDC004368]